MALVQIQVNGKTFVGEGRDRAAVEAVADDLIAKYRKSGFKWATFHLKYYDADLVRSVTVEYDQNGTRHEEPETPDA